MGKEKDSDLNSSLYEIIIHNQTYKLENENDN